MAPTISFQPSESPSPSEVPSQSPAPTSSVAPSMAPTISFQPSDSPSLALDRFLNLTLPEYTLQSLQDFDTPQSKALFWIFSSYVDYLGLPTWRKKQLIALASLFYAFKGERWDGNWLDGNEECLWKDSTAVAVLETTTATVLQRLDPCNEMGQIQAIWLVGLDLSPRAEPLPREMEFLSHLRSFALIHSGVYAPLEDILPGTFYNLSSLEELVLADNKFLGNIPTNLGLLTNLQRLDLHENRLARLIPSELGMLTALEYLDLSSNSLTGLLPSELGLLTSLKMLNVSGNFLGGPIPPEIQILQTNYSLTGFHT